MAVEEDSEEEEQVVGAEEAAAEVAVEIVDDGKVINFPHFIKKKLNFKLKNFIYLQIVCVYDKLVVVRHSYLTPKGPYLLSWFVSICPPVCPNDRS